MPRYLVTIFGKDQDAMADLVREFKIDVLRHTTRQLKKGDRYSVDAVVDYKQIRSLKAKGYEITTRENVDKVGKERQKEVGRGDRYKRPGPK